MSIHKKTRMRVWLRDSWKCHYCGQSLDIETATVDHIKPKCIGGTNDTTNLITSCKPCNCSKGNMLVGQFCEIKGVTIPKPQKAGPLPKKQHKALGLTKSYKPRKKLVVKYRPKGGTWCDMGRARSGSGKLKKETA